jgi:putative glycerol-1-phosphate prenyltransferase
MGSVLSQLVAYRQQGRKGFAVLVDPDKVSTQDCRTIAEKCNAAGVDLIFFGGSLMVSNHVDECILALKEVTQIPIVLFPGSPHQLSAHADALLYLSLVSGRNPEMLIGAHVTSAPMVKASGLEVMSTGYMVVDGGAPTTVSYISGSAPLPANKNDIAVCTAMAAELQGKHLLYMDAGSGAQNPISESMIKAVVKNTKLPLVVGGGIVEPEQAYLRAKAGADIIVVGNAIEKDISLISEMSIAIHTTKHKIYSS